MEPGTSGHHVSYAIGSYIPWPANQEKGQGHLTVSPVKALQCSRELRTQESRQNFSDRKGRGNTFEALVGVVVVIEEWITILEWSCDCLDTDHQRASIGGGGRWWRPTLRDRGGVIARGGVVTYRGVASRPIVVAQSTLLMEKTSPTTLIPGCYIVATVFSDAIVPLQYFRRCYSVATFAIVIRLQYFAAPTVSRTMVFPLLHGLAEDPMSLEATLSSSLQTSSTTTPICSEGMVSSNSRGSNLGIVLPTTSFLGDNLVTVGDSIQGPVMNSNPLPMGGKSLGFRILVPLFRSPLTQVRVRFYDLSWEYWHPKIIFDLARGIGVPLRLDKATIDGDFRHYARVLVDVDMSALLPSSVLLERDDFHSSFISVEYENLPSFCSICSSIGHLPGSYHWNKSKVPTASAGKSSNLMAEVSVEGTAFQPVRPRTFIDCCGSISIPLSGAHSIQQDDRCIVRDEINSSRDMRLESSLSNSLAELHFIADSS
ncbi:hypothetical protein Dsin_022770 [Dipteronia sinensis]|uniref:DUF4283 domain-containing protein n=1 Tax=Dipteronia sinensis TaxID=43782 RepID=A0AAE0A2K6_9ROSI|nr:hypothetical protein Dsin_022770 [Dipteronia sinensis]